MTVNLIGLIVAVVLLLMGMSCGAFVAGKFTNKTETRNIFVFFGGLGSMVLYLTMIPWIMETFK